jgi:hypothetical protein
MTRGKRELPMKKLLMPATPLAAMKKIAFAILCATALMLVAAPVRADLCPAVGQATGCGAVITVTSVDGGNNANAFSVTITGALPFDGTEDTLVGVQNNSGGVLKFLTLASSSSIPIFGFDGDGVCTFITCTWPNPTGYEGPNNSFSVVDVNHGTVNFTNAISNGGSTWFSLEGTPQSLTLLSESVKLHYTGGVANQTQTAPFGNGGNAHAFALTIPTVNNSFDVIVTANYVDTEVSNGGITGAGIADGVCEAGTSTPIADNDIDCRLAKAGFVFATLGNGDQVVSHCTPYHNGQCVWYRATTTAGAGTDYVGPVSDFIGWNTDVTLANPSPNGEYQPGWNHNNARLYDRRGTDSSNSFKFDITDFFNPSCTASGCGPDPGGGGHQPTLNDWVFADVPNPQGTPDAVETLIPIPGVSPFPYIAGLPMLVSFELETAGTEIHDPTALTMPHTVNIATLDPHGVSIPVQFPKGFPTTFTYSKLLHTYSIFLSPAPYKTDGTVYTMQIGSDLFPAPVTVTFVVKKLGH